MPEIAHNPLMAPQQRTIFMIFAIALASRLVAVALYPGPDYYEGLSQSYLQVIDNIVSGKGVVVYVDVARKDADQPDWRYVPFIDRPLGYLVLIFLPSVLAGPTGIQVFQAFLSAFSAVLLFLLARKLLSESTAWIAGLAYSFWPLSARFETTILPDAVMPFFLITTLSVLVQSSSEFSSPRRFGLAGVFCGIGMTMRPDVLFLPLFLLAPLAVFPDGTMKFRRILYFLAGTALILTIHTVRNYDATDGEILPLGLGNGISMWEGISQFGDTLGTVYGDDRMTQLEGYRQWAYPDGVDRDRRRFGEALRIISENPMWYAGVMIRRIPVLLVPDGIITSRFAPSIRDFLKENDHGILDYVIKHPVSSLVRAMILAGQLAILGLAFWAVLKDRMNRLLWLPAAIVLYYILVHIPTNTEARYFYPAIPLVLLLAAHGFNLIHPFSPDDHAR